MTGLPGSLLAAVLTIGLLLSGALVLLAAAAYVRRPRRSTLLVALAFGTLFADTLVAVFMLEGLVSREVHHLVEHVLVVVLAVLVLAAVYYGRTVERRHAPDVDEHQ